MKLTTAAKQILKYFTLEDGIVGSLIDVRRKPKLEEYEIIADLHCHPNINNLDDLLHTVRVCKRNSVGLCAIVQHYNGANPHNSKEMDYWDVLDLIKDNDLPIKISDDELSFELNGVKFIGGYEYYGTLKGVKARLDLVPILPDKQFRKELRDGESIQNLVEVCRKHNAIIIGAHPYTLWNPWLLKRIPFRLAYEGEREIIQEELFPLVDTVDCPASNALWMLESNRLVKEDYWSPIFTSDTHAKRRSMRNEIGRAGIILDKSYLEGDLRLNLVDSVSFGDFISYEDYIPALQFLFSFVL